MHLAGIEDTAGTLADGVAWNNGGSPAPVYYGNESPWIKYEAAPVFGELAQFYMNDRRCGELAQVAAWAGMYNVPMLFVTGDQAACDEARELLLF